MNQKTSVTGVLQQIHLKGVLLGILMTSSLLTVISAPDLFHKVLYLLFVVGSVLLAWMHYYKWIPFAAGVLLHLLTSLVLGAQAYVGFQTVYAIGCWLIFAFLDIKSPTVRLLIAVPLGSKFTSAESLKSVQKDLVELTKGSFVLKDEVPFADVDGHYTVEVRDPTGVLSAVSVIKFHNLKIV